MSDVVTGHVAREKARTGAPVAGQFATAARFAVREQARNRLAGLLLVLFVPAWYLLMETMAGHTPLGLRLFATGRELPVDSGQLILTTAGFNSLTIIVGFAVFDAVRRTLVFDRRLVFAGYRRANLITAKTAAIALAAVVVAVYTSAVLLVFWRPSLGAWGAIVAGFAVVSATYGAFGMLLGVLVKRDLEGFFLIIMGGLTDTFLQNPLGNPLANKEVLRWFPTFGPSQFADGAAFGHTVVWGYLGIGLLWTAGFTACGLLVFYLRTRIRRGHARRG